MVRGPIATRIINQLLLATEWGDLDYLVTQYVPTSLQFALVLPFLSMLNLRCSQVVDMPPGTGDIQITLSQSACMSGAVIVTTPHTLSLVDAAKGKDTLKQK